MKVWKVSHEGVINLEDLGPSQVKKDCVKLKMLSATLSSTDKLAFKGKLNGCELPIVLGRQGSGMVSEVDPSVSNFKRGDRVYVSSQVACNECYFCKMGHGNECMHTQTYGKDIDGVLSDFAIVNTNNLFLLPDRISDEEAVFVESVSLAIHTINTLKVGRGDHFVILGASVFGLVLAQVALYYQAVPILVDKRADRLALAEQSDIYYCINSAKEDVNKRVFAITGGKMASRVAFTLDDIAPVKFDETLCLVAKYGQIGFVGVDPDVDSIEIDIKSAVDKNISVFGINNSNEYISSAINMIANKEVEVSPLMQVIKFKEVKDYIERYANGESFLQLVVLNK